MTYLDDKNKQILKKIGNQSADVVFVIHLAKELTELQVGNPCGKVLQQLVSNLFSQPFLESLEKKERKRFEDLQNVFLVAVYRFQRGDSVEDSFSGQTH